MSALLAVVLLVPGSAVAANPAGDLDQCGNGQFASPSSCPPGWENGNLNASKSHYREGDSVPFRLLLTNLATSGTHTVVIQYDTLQSSKHAYDYLTSFNRTVGDADACGSGGAAGGSAVSPCSSGGSFPIPSAGISFTNPGSSQVGGSVSIWNGTLTGVSYGGASDASGQQSVTIKFTAANATVVLAWGGHVASQIDWGLGSSAGAIPGSPYHMRLKSLDGAGGNQDRSLAAASILPIPASFETTASKSSVVIGQPVTDTATLSGANGPVSGSVKFFVCGPNVGSNPDCTSGGTQVGSAKSFSNGTVDSDPYTPSQPGRYCFRAEYTPDVFAPYSASNHTNQTTECFEATLPPFGDIEVVKSLPSGVGTFDLFIKSGDGSSTLASATNVGNGGTTGKKTLDTGTYQVGETAHAGTSLSDYDPSIECRSSGGSGDVVASGAGAGPVNVSLANGASVKCVITNALKPLPKVTVSKVCPNGKAADTDRFAITNNGQATGTVLDCGGSANVEVAAGQSYSIDEAAAATTSLGDYTKALSGACTGTLARGQTASCTITNTLKAAPHVTVHKVCPTGKAADTDRFAITNNGQATGAVLDCGESADVAVVAGQQYSLDEVGAGTPAADLASYAKALGSGCAGTLARGESGGCTITNTLKAKPHVTVTKVCPNGKANDSDRFGITNNGVGTDTTLDCGGSAQIDVGAGQAYAIDEVGANGADLLNYTKSLAPTCAGTLAHFGDSAECTITNRLKAAPHVTVHKVCPNGKANDSDRFGITSNGQSTRTVLDCGDSANVTVGAGEAFAIDEVGAGTPAADLDDYTKLLSDGCSGTLAHYGDSADCTITNTLKGSFLTVVKQLSPADDPGTFDLLVDGVAKATGVGDGGTTGAVEVTQGQHTVSELASAGTSLDDYTSVISGDCAADGTVTVKPGESKTCTITNTLKPSHLTVIKQLVPADDSGKFDLLIDGVAKATAVGDGGTTGAVEVTKGEHTVTETGANGTSLDDYTSVISGDCSADGHVTLKPGESKTCTITNTLKPSHLTVIKQLVPADDPGRFDLLIDGDVKASAVGDGGSTGAVELAPGGHLVSEDGADTSLAKYDRVIGGDCDADGHVTLKPGESKTCTITNTRKTGHLTVTKRFVGRNGLVSLFIVQGDRVIAVANDVADGGTLGPETVDTGSYTVAERAGEDTSLGDYTSRIDCVAGERTVAAGTGTFVEVAVGEGDDVHCTITNTLKTGTIEVRKSLFPSGDAGKFNLLVDDAVKATNVGNNGSTGLVTVVAGTHKVSETAGTATSLGDYTSSIDCQVAGISIAKGGGTSLAGVLVAPGANVVCIVTNTHKSTPPPPTPKTGTIEVVKTLLPATDAGRFDLQIDGVTKKAGAGDGGTTSAVTVSTGTHTVGELAAVGTSMSEYTSSIQCKQDTTVLASGGGTGPLSVNVTPDAHVVCTITNVRKAIDLVITKRAVPTTAHVGDRITYTIVVTNKGPGTATGVTMSDPMPALVDFVSVSTSQGSCTGGTVVSCSLGTLAAGASATITVVGKAKAAGTAVNTAVTVASEPEANTGDNRASAIVKIIAVAQKKQVFLPPTCYSATVTPHQLTVGKRQTIVVRLGAGKKAVRHVKVLVRGPGILKWGTTDARGVARISVKPKRSGILSVTVPSHKTCTQPQVGVVGIFTPPVTG